MKLFLVKSGHNSEKIISLFLEIRKLPALVFLVIFLGSSVISIGNCKVKTS